MRTISMLLNAMAAAGVVAIGAPAFAASASAVPAAAIGGAKPGMIYSEVRKRLITSGFKPVPRPADQFCGYSASCKLPETDACAGTGEGQCSYVFIKGNRRIQVMGRGGREDQPQSQDVYAIDYEN